MEKQVLSNGGLWCSYGLALLIMFIAVTGAAIKDIRLVKATAKRKPE
jgi:hypothetical protein